MECNCKNTQELRIVRGNAFAIRLTVTARHADGTVVEDFVLDDAQAVLKVVHNGTATATEFVIINNDAIINFGGDLSLGWYGLEMTGTFNGKPWRWYVPQVFQIVETSAKANIPDWAFLTDNTYLIEGVTTITSGEIYQADWNEKDTTSPSYIKNKPELGIYATKTQLHSTEQQLQHNIDSEEIRAKDAEKQNADDIDALEARMGTAEDDIDAIESKIPAAASSENKLIDKQQMDNATADFITKSVNDLVNYYLKSETYTKAEVQQLIAAVKQFTYEVVQTLPTASASTMNKIYLVPSTNPQTENVKDEYITIATDNGGTITYSWEQIGTTTVDLSGYYTSAQTDQAISNALNTALADYSTTQQMNSAITNALNTALADYSTTTEMTAAIAAAIANYYTKSEVDALIANFITRSVNDLLNYYLKSETYTKAEVQQLIAAVKQFTYEVVTTLPTASASTMHKIYLVPSTNPQTENVKDEYITIATDNGGTVIYSWEQIGTTTVDLSGYYTSAQTDQAISNALTAALAAYSTTSEMNSAITTALNNALAAYSTTAQMNAAIAAALTPYYTKTEIDTLLGNKADIDGNYPELVAGNIVGTVSQEAQFLFRKTADGLPSSDAHKVNQGARLQSVKGNSVAWSSFAQKNGIRVTNCTVATTDKGFTVSATPTASDKSADQMSLFLNTTHVYYVCFDYKSNLDFSIQDMRNIVNLTATNNGHYSNVGVMRSNVYTSLYWYLYTENTETWNLEVTNYKVFDLTTMLGAGNEPATPDAFEAWLQANVGLQPYYAYNAGELLSCKMLGIKTVGFNAWDEEWEVGGYNNYTGEKDVRNNYIRSSNSIRVFGGQEYYFKGKILLYGYRGDGTFYGSYNPPHGWGTDGGANWIENSTLVFPQEIVYLRISTETSYNHDICISISDQSKNGTYEPYDEHSYPLDSSKVYGKLDGEGELVQIFPNGMKSAGSVRDELTINGGVTKAIKRVGSMDLGTLTWNKDPKFSGLFFVDISSYLRIYDNYTSLRDNQISVNSKYAMSGAYLLHDDGQVESGPDKTAWLQQTSLSASRWLQIKDTSLYNSGSADDFKAALSGVMFYYELAEYAEYTDLVYRDNGADIPLQELNLYLKEDADGTEQVLVASPVDENPTSVSPILTLLYGMNAAGVLKTMPDNYVMATMQQQFTQQQQARARENIGAQGMTDVLSLIRANEDALLTALKTAGTITDYTLDADADNNGVFPVTVS